MPNAGEAIRDDGALAKREGCNVQAAIAQVTEGRVKLHSYLLPDVQPSADDGRILKLMSNLPARPVGSPRFGDKVGITNVHGVVYRAIQIPSAFELLHLTARLNAIGYGIDHSARRHRQAYARIFSKVGKTD